VVGGRRVSREKDEMGEDEEGGDQERKGTA
jgi:hypothetical protein